MLFRTMFFAFTAVLFTAPCNAATYYVAGNASAANTACTAAAPCTTLAAAYNHVAPGDAIVCVTPPIPGHLSIDSSVTVDCASARAPVRDDAIQNGTAQDGILINIPVSSSDPQRTVRLRGLSVDGSISNVGGSPSGRYLDRGIDIQAAAAVYIEDCMIQNVNEQGIYDHRTGGQTKLFIKDTIVSGAGGPGVALGSQGPNTNLLENVFMEYNAYGIAAASGNNVVINHSAMSGNSTAGVEGDPGAQIVVNNSAISHNNIGVQSSSSVRVSNDDIVFNSTAISGTTGSFGNNRFSGNSSMGSGLMPLGSASTDLGQQ